jgi:hypothetical protein
MAISKKLGQNYEAIRAAARFKTIKVTLNDLDFELKVRVPVKREMEEIMAAIANPNKDEIERIYQQLSSPLLKSIEDAGEGFVDALNEGGEKVKVLEDDIVVDGNSIRKIAQLSAIWQTQVERYFALLQSATGEPINESFEEISEEFPDAIVKEIIDKIDAAIRPNYGEAKKN